MATDTLYVDAAKAQQKARTALDSVNSGKREAALRVPGRDTSAERVVRPDM